LSDTALDDLLRALADPTRRRLFRTIADQPGITTGELAGVAPGMTRWSVMKHLAVLREARLVQTLYDGRRRRHYADRRALRPIADWLAEGRAG
jgi:DNA-binding transcriptional ArsR family regulator